MKNNHRRRRLWVDPAFQFRLLARIAVYLVLVALFTLHIGFIFDVMANITTHGSSQRMDVLYLAYLQQQKHLLLAAVLVMPIMLYDLLKFSHRVAGPLYRCRKVMQEMAEGKCVPEFKPRKHDLMGEFFAAFNALIQAWNVTRGSSGNGRPHAANLVEAGAERAGPLPQREVLVERH
jgi:hypothetical protein